MALADESKKDMGKSHAKDMSKLTCGEFIQMGAPDAVMTLFWIDGYLKKEKDKPVWDAETFVEHRDKLVKICTEKVGKDKLVLEEVRNLS